MQEQKVYLSMTKDKLFKYAICSKKMQQVNKLLFCCNSVYFE